MRLEFQSTRPARGATSPAFLAMQKPRISIHAPREGRDKVMPRPTTESEISIHAPREGRDRGRATAAPDLRYFNPRAPRGARRLLRLDLPARKKFQSTRPARGATDLTSVIRCRERWWHFNPRAPRGARPTRATGENGRDSISIHAPREGRDSKSEQISLHIFAKKAWIPDIFAHNAAFQSVLPLADRQKLLYLRCEPLRKFLRAFASHYKIIGSSGR